MGLKKSKGKAVLKVDDYDLDRGSSHSPGNYYGDKITGDGLQVWA